VKNYLPLALCFIFVTCSGFVCTGSQIHQVNVANADLAIAINKASVTVIQLTQQGTLTQAEENAILPKLYDASVLSDGINKCTVSLSAGQTLPSCVTPLLQSVQNDMAAASLGVKSPGAQAYMTVAISGVTAIFAEFVQANMTAPTVTP